MHEATREIILKIVYHGMAMCGKTTSLMFLNHHLPPNQRGKFITLETPTERTLYFDFLPVNLDFRGYKVRFLVYTTPGQEYYEASRRLVLQGADGIVFVVDSQRGALDGNLAALAMLEKNLMELGQKASLLPRVIQYNKRDVQDAIPLGEAEHRLNGRMPVPSYPAIAKTGLGVYETFLSVAKLALNRIVSGESYAQHSALFTPLVITETDRCAFERILAGITGADRAQGTLLVDESGGLLAMLGNVPAKDYETMVALLACNFNAAQELVFSLAGKNFTGIVQEGAGKSIVALRVDQRRFLVLLVDARVGNASLRLVARSAAGKLADLLKVMDEESSEKILKFAGDFASIGRPALTAVASV